MRIILEPTRCGLIPCVCNVEASMAHRRIGQERLALSPTPEPNRWPLDEIDTLIDWMPIAQTLNGIYGAD